MGNISKSHPLKPHPKEEWGVHLADTDVELFKTVTGDRRPPKKRPREIWICGGRRMGKDSVASAIAAHEAAYRAVGVLEFDPVDSVQDSAVSIVIIERGCGDTPRRLPLLHAVAIRQLRSRQCRHGVVKLAAVEMLDEGDDITAVREVQSALAWLLR